MIHENIETRDWLNTIEPHNVHFVMKGLVEELTCIDEQVGFLLRRN